MDKLHYYKPDWIVPTDQVLEVDVCIYGASSAGVIAAIETAERGKTVVLLQPGPFIGGLTTGGLGWTDHGKAHVIGGKSREFYRRCGTYYGKTEEWYFEPHVAQTVYDQWLKQHGVTPILYQYLQSIDLQNGRIMAVRMLGGLTVKANVYLDCTYEGDLMAAAKVSYHVGREGNSLYGETLNGIQVRELHQFVPARVDPYVRPGDPSSGLLPQIEAADLSRRMGQPDHRVQAYNFRICMTDDPALKIPWEKPEHFNPQEYILAARWFDGEKDFYNEQLRTYEGRVSQVPCKFDIFPNRTAGGYFKTDTNNHGPVSSDYIGMSWGWAEGSYEYREKLFQSHVTYQKGLYWFLSNAPEIPDRYRQAYARWGLCRDEFVETGGWSPQLYVREARRMVSDYVITEHDCMHRRQCDDPVGMGSYSLDSHNCTRFVNADGKVMNEGDVQVKPAGPYRISYRSIVPRGSECTNLLVPVCCSTSHIAYGSVRMEPVFMILGQSAAVAACMSIDDASAVQNVSYRKLREELLRLGQVLELDRTVSGI